MLLKRLAKKVIYQVNRNLTYRRKEFLVEVQKRAILPLTSIEELSKNISIFSAYSTEIHPPNDWYGHASILKKFLGLPESYQFKFSLEHGVVLSDYVNPLDLEVDFQSIITFSKFREQILKKYKPYIFSIGPRIHYAPHYLSEKKLHEEKKRLGKTLLVFPSHSTLELDAHYDIEKFCGQIRDLGKKYQSIRVCLYWKDILKGYAKIYTKWGFECVTAGHILDPNFLPRLKSIIYLSDFTFSNDAGTHIGYCIYLDKPHLISHQPHNFTGRNSEVKLAKRIYHDKPYIEVIKNFSKYQANITSSQKEIVEKYWGINETKTKKELLTLVDQTEKLFFQNRYTV
jgi:hypothetical protein